MIIWRTTIWVIKGDARILDYSSFGAPKQFRVEGLGAQVRNISRV